MEQGTRPERTPCGSKMDMWSLSDWRVDQGTFCSEVRLFLEEAMEEGLSADADGECIKFQETKGTKT